MNPKALPDRAGTRLPDRGATSRGILPLWAGALALTFGAAAVADTEIKTTNEFSGDVSTDTIYIKGGKIRVDTGRGDSFMIFDSKARTITSVEPSEKSYTVMTEENLRSMGSAVQQAMQRLEEQLANMPPEQRERMREMMEQQMGAMMGGASGKPKETEIARTGQTRTVAGYDCEVVNIIVDGEHSGNACMADYDSLGIDQADRNTIESMMEFSSAITEQFGDLVPAQMKAMAAEGYPVSYESRMGSTNVSGRLESIESRSLPAELFTVPSGYSQRTLPSMPGG